MIPVDLRRVFHDALLADRRPPDGLLHCSSHMRGSLRHAMLEVAGAPQIASEIVSDIRLMTGTMWHDWAHKALVRAGIPFMQEVRLNDALPEGWGGTADWLFWNQELRGFALGDKKTIKGEGLRWIQSGGVKEEHLWQTSAYWHALFDMGFPMVQGIAVLYWPMNDTSDRNEVIVPVVVEFDPLPREKVHAVMNERWAHTKRYIDKLASIGGPNMIWSNPELYLQPELAPVQDRVQEVRWNPKTAGGCFDVKLVPHWSAAYCPFPNELCGCSTQGQTKIGQYDLDGNYTPRKDWEHVIPMVAPDEREVKRRRQELDKKEATNGATESSVGAVSDA